MLHQIGVGALGPVFRTYEPTRDRLVAVKVFRLDVTPEQAQTLADELARAADAGLFHPSIVEPIAAGVEGTVAYRAEEYVAAESLDVAMRHYAPAALGKALPFITQLGGAIDFARAAGVGHGALHPRDVFVTPDEARATGFGVVDALDRVGLRAPVRRPYSAPERIRGEAWSTPADVFSLAAVAYELLTAIRPSGTGEQIAPLDSGSVGDRASAIHAVLARAMHEDPGRRFQSALEFVAALEDAANRGTGTRDRGVPVLTGAVPPHEAAPADPLDTLVVDREIDDPPANVVPIREQPRVDASAREFPVSSEPGQPERFVDDFVEPNEAAARVDADLLNLDDEILEVRPAAVEFSEAEDARAELRDDLRPVAPGAASYARAIKPPLSGGLPVDERPRPAMLPLALTLVVGLLIGFAVGWALADRDQALAPESGQVASQQPPATPRAGDKAASQPWSEQDVAPRPEAPPAVPPDAAEPKPAGAGTGRIVVRSTPPDAGVTVNGSWRGRTPLTLEELPFGSYSVRVVQPGYLVEEDDLTLSPEAPARTLAVRLRRTPAPAASAAAPPPRAPEGDGPGSIYVDSLPRGARVLVNGEPVGVTPLRIAEVRSGTHTVSLELPDHQRWTSTTRVVPGQEARVTGSLERIR